MWCNRRWWLKVASFLFNNVFRGHWHMLEDIRVTVGIFRCAKIWFRDVASLKRRLVNVINRWRLEKALNRRDVTIDLVACRWREECRRCFADFRDVKVRLLPTGHMRFLEHLHGRLTWGLLEEKARSWWSLHGWRLERPHQVIRWVSNKRRDKVGTLRDVCLTDP